EFAKASRGLAMCHMQLRNYDRAEALFRKIISERPSDLKTRHAIARMYVQAGRHAEAINELLQIQQRDPNAKGIDVLLAACYSRTEALEKALKAYRKILQRDAEDWRSAMELGKLLLRMGRHHEAAHRFQQGLDDLPLSVKFDRETLEELVVELRAGPAVVKKREGVKAPEEWLEILLNSVEVERRRRAVRILAASPVRHAELDKGFLRALQDKDYVVRTLAVQTIGRWWGEAEQLHDPRLVKIMSILLNDPSHRVRGSVAATLGRADHARAVPPLMKRLKKEKDPYVFRQLHRALNRLTFAYIGIPLEGELDVERMEALTRDWQAHYDGDREKYRRYEGK
ncbi:MAG: tetratricopeptide repeat protein, partial [Planctomycetes bacterium]|nr:tetratricopeptide repeat protein [Planctomycetota bacterium]